jgi:hypothetical protein
MAAAPSDDNRAAVQAVDDGQRSEARQSPADADRPAAPSAPRFGAIQFLAADDLEAGAACDLDGECC